jgi:hypothetical protein
MNAASRRALFSVISGIISRGIACLNNITSKRWFCDLQGPPESVGKKAMAIARVVHEPVLGCKTVAFDEHALTRMGERAASEDEVIEVLRSPDQTGLPTQPLPLPEESRGPRSIDVVFAHDLTQIVVVTVIAR